MGAFDRLASYSAKRGYEKAPLSPSEYGELFKKEIHKLGYATVSGTGAETELATVLSSCGNQVINAIAGSGKTTALAFKIIYDIQTGAILTKRSLPNGAEVSVVDKTWVCTFLRSGASDLKNKVDSWQRKLGYMPRTDEITFSTLDAEFLHTLEGLGVKIKIGDTGRLFTLLCRAVDSCGCLRSDGGYLEREDYKIIQTIVTYYRGRLDNQKYAHPSMLDYNLTPTMLDSIVNQYSMLKKADVISDFEDIQELLYKFLYVTPNPSVQDFVASRYKYIYVDEFQDTSQIQYALLKFYARGSLWINKDGNTHTDTPLWNGKDVWSKIVAVGDVSQCIYSFKGSDSKILAQDFENDFRPVVCTLSCNWRCPSNILSPVVTSIHLNKDSANQAIFSSKQGGDFSIKSVSTLKQMLTMLKEDVAKDIEAGHSVAILTRTNYDGVLPALILETTNTIDFSLTGTGMTLQGALARKLLGVSALFTERSSPAVEQALNLLIPYNRKYEVTNLIKTLKLSNMSVWSVPDADLAYSTPCIANIIVHLKKSIYVNGVRDKAKEVECLKAVYWHLRQNKFKGTTTYSENARAYLDLLLYILDSQTFVSINEFLDVMSVYSDRLDGRVSKPNTQVVISTVHEYKGKEADSVIVWNDSEGNFPSSKCDLTNEEQLNEERRVHYIACTRAKKVERIYTLTNKKGMFVSEMDAPITYPDIQSVTIQ